MEYHIYPQELKNRPILGKHHAILAVDLALKLKLNLALGGALEKQLLKLNKKCQLQRNCLVN